MDSIAEDSIAGLAQTCLDSFKQLSAAVIKASDEYSDLVPPEKIEKEVGRLNIWCGNLGALQTGKSSLDSRLHGMAVVHTNVAKHLGGLDQTLIKSIEIVSGTRLPLEKQLTLDWSSNNSETSSEESKDDEEPPRELALNMTTIQEILDDSYKLSLTIRNCLSRASFNSELTLYSEVDTETEAGHLESDVVQVKDVLLQIRGDAAKQMKMTHSETARLNDLDDYLIFRLAATISKRLKILRHWQRCAQQFPKSIIEHSC